MKAAICFFFGHNHKTDILDFRAGPLGYAQALKRITCLRCGDSSEWIYLSKNGMDIYAIENQSF